MNLYLGDVRDGLREFIAAGVRAQTCVTSPPYWGLRDYGTAEWDGGAEDCDHRAPSRFDYPLQSGLGPTGSQSQSSNAASASGNVYQRNCGKCGATRIDKQLGLEPTIAEYVANMVDVFRLVRDVLADDGTLWLNLGDSYAGSGKGRNADGTHQEGGKQGTNGGSIAGTLFKTVEGKPKDLCGVPWRVAFALQADGWYLRSDIIWHKPNPMPESVTDRPTKAHEYLFLMAKSERYYYDAAAIAEASIYAGEQSGIVRGTKRRADSMGVEPTGNEKPGADAYIAATRNRRSVWSITTQPFADAHFAVMPTALVEPCIMAGTSEKGHCPTCGKGWIRVMAREQSSPSVALSDVRDGIRARLIGGQYQKWLDENPAKTTGWQPSCDCNASDPIPGVVLDPFMGSGTVAQVAQDLGRQWIGCELNPEYAKMIDQRTRQAALILAAD